MKKLSEVNSQISVVNEKLARVREQINRLKWERRALMNTLITLKVKRKQLIFDSPLFKEPVEVHP